MRGRREGLIAAVVLLALLVPSAARAADPSEVQAVAGQFWVPGSPVHMTADRSGQPAAQALRSEIALMLDAGLTADKIRQIMVDRYGEAILAAPPAHGFKLTAWVIPAIALGTGLAFLLLVLRRWVHNYRAKKLSSEVYES